MLLDCHTKETTLNSISDIYNIKASELLSYLRNLDLSSFYSDSNFSNYIPPQKKLSSLLENEFKVNPNPLSMVYWFHLTRALPGETFESGILPLNQVIDKIWSSISEIIPEHAEALEAMRSKKELDGLYNLKINDSAHHGPYAVLVRDVAFCEPDIGKHFLELPEIIEDICNSYSDNSGHSIHQQIKNEMRPCIVKFKSRKRLERDCVESAVYYLYLMENKEPMDEYANTSFNSNNIAIPYSDIIDIQYVAL